MGFGTFDPDGDFAVVTIECVSVRLATVACGQPTERVLVSREKWRMLADSARDDFNKRLKVAKLPAGRWSYGANRIDRLLGKELCVLLWAVEHAELGDVTAAVANWRGLRPEDRWWLFTTTCAETGGVADGDRGWRKALRFALTENPTR